MLALEFAAKIVFYVLCETVESPTLFMNTKHHIRMVYTSWLCLVLTIPCRGGYSNIICVIVTIVLLKFTLFLPGFWHPYCS